MVAKPVGRISVQTIRVATRVDQRRQLLHQPRLCEHVVIMACARDRTPKIDEKPVRCHHPLKLHRVFPLVPIVEETLETDRPVVASLQGYRKI